MEIYAQPGYGGTTASPEAYMQLKDRSNGYATVAEFTLRYLPDSNEVVLLKGDEAVYSELLA